MGSATYNFVCAISSIVTSESQLEELAPKTPEATAWWAKIFTSRHSVKNVMMYEKITLTDMYRDPARTFDIDKNRSQVIGPTFTLLSVEITFSAMRSGDTTKVHRAKTCNQNKRYLLI